VGAQTLRKIIIFTLPSQTLPETYLYFAHKNSPKLNNFYILRKNTPENNKRQILKPHETNLFAAGRPASLQCLFSPNILTFSIVSDSKDLQKWRQLSKFIVTNYFNINTQPE
jgi:hypothetical protein